MEPSPYTGHNEYADCTDTDCGNFVGRFAESSARLGVEYQLQLGKPSQPSAASRCLLSGKGRFFILLPMFSPSISPAVRKNDSARFVVPDRHGQSLPLPNQNHQLFASRVAGVDRLRCKSIYCCRLNKRQYGCLFAGINILSGTAIFCVAFTTVSVRARWRAAQAGRQTSRAPLTPHGHLPDHTD